MGNPAPHFARVVVEPQNFERIDGSQFWINPALVQNEQAVMAAASVIPASWSGTLVHSIPVSYQVPEALVPDNIGIQITPSVVIP